MDFILFFLAWTDIISVLNFTIPTLVPEVFSLSGAPKVQMSGEAKPNTREPLGACCRNLTSMFC